jgi:hypothetical protein
MTNTTARTHLIANILKLAATAIETTLTNDALTTLISAAMNITRANCRPDAGLIFADTFQLAGDAGAFTWNSQINPARRAEALRIAARYAIELADAGIPLN